MLHNNSVIPCVRCSQQTRQTTEGTEAHRRGGNLMPSAMPCSQQIYIQPNRSGHARRQLPKECVGVIDIHALAVLGFQQSTFFGCSPGSWHASNALKLLSHWFMKYNLRSCTHRSKAR